MTRPCSRLAAACLAAGLVTTLASAPASARPRAAEEDGDPLGVTIESLTPAAIPQSGPLRVTGTITNNSAAVWSDLQVYPLTSYTPFTTEEELTEALASDPASYVGPRRTALLTNIPDLAPGESTTYQLRIPRKQLSISGDQGVYWLGVQVLGDEDGVRLDGADGRARTLVPLIRKQDPPTASLGVILPFRARIGHDSNGKVIAPDVWQRALSDAGRFGRLVKLSRTAKSFPLTWLVDPALVDVARAIGDDNPGLDLGPATVATEPTPSPTPSGDGEQADEPAEVSSEAEAVRAWLASFVAEGAARDVLTLPYGDIDVAAAYRVAYGDLVDRALRVATAVLDSVELDATPVVDPPDGALPWSAVNRLDPRVPLVLDDAAVAAGGPRVDIPNGPRLTLVSSAAGQGIPGDVTPTGALDVRQRIVAQAALHALSPDADRPLVVQLPDRWDPGVGWRKSKFFKGLDLPWLSAFGAGSTIRSATTAETIEPDSSDLVYPEEPRELGLTNFTAAQGLIRAGGALDVLLSSTEAVEPQLARMALAGVSGQLREETEVAASRLTSLRRAVEQLLGKVSVSGPTFVTMSSEDGRFPAVVTNGLDQPITVALRARAIGTDDVRIPSPDAVTITGGQRRTVPMHANSNRTGLWPVEVRAVNSDGTAVGEPMEFNLRSSNVGQYIWALLGSSSFVLVVLIFLRVRRRVRARQSTPGPLLRQDS